ncbi:MAG TPA: GNA1162 family protein [Methylomirabilota bacterium]|jgi:hypothetical protein|nr:GNA1162 family protein [Methylomirabilota bacterium]
MSAAWVALGLSGALAGLVLSGCAATPYDYTNYRAHPPRSILVLPPLNEGTDIRGTYGYLSTVTRPLAEMGYYVYPVVLIDQFLKDNGLPTPGEMVQAPLPKIREIIGADAVLYVTLQQYGTRYQLLSSTTAVVAVARLVDTRTGTLLWEATLAAQEGSAGSGNVLADLIGAAITQAIGHSTDHAHDVAGQANAQFAVKGRGLLHGPYSPRYGQE